MPYTNPNTWGPSFWFTLHNGAANYPTNPSPYAINQMTKFVSSIPIMLPCENCSEHARAFIEKIYNQLPQICSSRDTLFDFFVDFHNYVNARFDKPIVSYSEARILWKVDT